MNDEDPLEVQRQSIPPWLMPQAPSQAASDAMAAMVQIGCAQMIAQVFADCWGGMRL